MPDLEHQRHQRGRVLLRAISGLLQGGSGVMLESYPSGSSRRFFSDSMWFFFFGARRGGMTIQHVLVYLRAECRGIHRLGQHRHLQSDLIQDRPCRLDVLEQLEERQSDVATSSSTLATTSTGCSASTWSRGVSGSSVRIFALGSAESDSNYFRAFIESTLYTTL